MNRAAQWPTRSHAEIALRLSVLAGFAFIVIRTAWVSDDAYITFRTVDNLLHGDGPRWNVAERVQAYTHPLWMLLLAAIGSVSSQPYFNALAASVLASLLAASLLLYRVASTAWQGAAVLVLLCSARAFVDFSTSGLENPLSHLLLVLLVITITRPSIRRAWGALVVGSLILVNRQDLVWLIGPALAWHVWRTPEARRPLTLAAGLAPLVLWEVFSIIYYGFPVPNTAFAKLHTGLLESDLLRQGLWYLRESWLNDPLTLGAVGFAVAVGAIRRETRPLALGQCLYVGYVVWIGGDFMSGRFLAAPLFVGAIVLASLPTHQESSWMWTVPVALLAIGLINPLAPVRTGPHFGELRRYEDFHGITDERKYYYPRTGLLRANHAWQPPDIVERNVTDRMLAAGQRVTTRDAVGMFGYVAGPTLHVVDTFALCDPLLARLPATTPWRIGHFHRDLPDGYIPSLRTGTNQIADPGLAAYYDRLGVVVRGPLFTAARWRAILRLNAGLDDDLLVAYRRRPSASSGG